MVINSKLIRFFRKITGPFVKSKVVPSDPLTELGIDPHKPIIYILRYRSYTDLATASAVLEQLGLPQPVGEVHINDLVLPRTLFTSGRSGLFRADHLEHAKAQFSQLLQLHLHNEALDVQLLPISVFWGRNPGKGKPSVLQSLLDREVTNGPRKLLSVLLLGRDTFIRLSQAVSIRTMVKLHGADERSAQKLLRVARVHFYRQRQAIMGPRRSRRVEMVEAVVRTEPIQQAIDLEVEQNNVSREKAQKQAYHYAMEIAADTSNSMILVADRVLTRLWNRLYDGVEVNGGDKVRELAQHGHEVVYVPCHRSHMDYLLLTYVIYHQGLVTPNIAAGINLNFWPAGPIFRHSGAFFIRRSFHGLPLYARVFNEYLHQLFVRGYSVKFFLEGGRSRTGRLLPAKTGMLSMTIQSLLRSQERPITLVPVYLGYENVMEVGSYLKELKGLSKDKEGIGQVFGAVRSLKQEWGRAYVNFGKPITLSDFLNRRVPHWRDACDAGNIAKPHWLADVSQQLGKQVLVNINNATAVNALNLTALILLAARQHALPRDEVVALLDCYLGLLRQVRYSHQVTVPDTSGSQMLEGALALGKFNVSQDDMGEIIGLDGPTAVAMTYYRNNILHLLILPSLIARFVIAHRKLSRDRLSKGIGLLFPLIQAELFLGLDAQRLESYCQEMIDAMCAAGLLRAEDDKLRVPVSPSRGYMQLNHLAQSVQETLQRYGIVLSLLESEQGISRSELERQSLVLAKRLSALYGINAPEFFDKKVLATFITRLRELGYVSVDEDGAGRPTAELATLADTLYPLLSSEVYQSLQYEMSKETAPT